MPIRIKNGTPATYGRITMPVGTYLPNQQQFSNPSAGAGGSVNGPLGTNPGLIQPPGQTQFGIQKSVLDSLSMPQSKWQNFWNLFSQFTSGAGPEAGMIPSTPNMAQNVAQSPLVQPQTAPTGIFEPPKLTSPSNSLVGQDVQNSPGFMTMSSLRQIFAGRSTQEISDAMAANGYTRTYSMGIGEVFIKSGEGDGSGFNPLAQQPTVDSRGRPDYVDGASLAPGQRVTASSGVTYAGGTPYTNPNTGETSGQYAITLPGIKSDPKGKFKWTSTVTRDADGNFVRVYRQQLRKVYTKRGRRQIAERQANASQEQAPAQVSSETASQLVSLRAQYG